MTGIDAQKYDSYAYTSHELGGWGTVMYHDGVWDEPIDGVGFADPGGRSALRAATKRNPRNLPCPSCGRKNQLTPIDRQRGYQCDRCADAAERGW